MDLGYSGLSFLSLMKYPQEGRSQLLDLFSQSETPHEEMHLLKGSLFFSFADDAPLMRWVSATRTFLSFTEGRTPGGVDLGYSSFLVFHRRIGRRSEGEKRNGKDSDRAAATAEW